MNLTLPEVRKAQLRRLGTLLASYLLLAADFLWQCGAAVRDRVAPFLPWLFGLIAMGFSLGILVVSAGYVIAKYGQILAIPVSPLTVCFVWGLAALMFSTMSLGKLMLRVTGHVTMNLSTVLQDTAAQVARLANASDTRRRRATKPAAAASPAGEGAFVPYSDEIGFQNELAAEMRDKGIAEENIADMLRESGRTVDASSGEPLG